MHRKSSQSLKRSAGWYEKLTCTRFHSTSTKLSKRRERYSIELTSQRVTLRLSLGRNIPQGLGDREQVQQLIINLIMNAVEAMQVVSIRTPVLLVLISRQKPRRDGFRKRQWPRNPGRNPKPSVRPILQHQARRTRYRSFDLPVDYRRSRWAPVGVQQWRRPWRDIRAYVDTHPEVFTVEY